MCPLVLVVPTVSFCQVASEVSDTNQQKISVPDSGKTSKFSRGTGMGVPDSNELIITQDSTPTKVKIKRFGKGNPNHSWKTATWMSAVLPGLGQVYNGKWWKVPIVYAGLGACGYFLVSYHLDFIKFRNGYRDKIDNIPNPDVDIYSADQVRTLRDQNRRTRDLLALITGAVYALNIIDAMVDGHLYKFDISDDLSMRIQPGAGWMPETGQGYVGFQLTLGFKRENRPLRLWKNGQGH